MQSESWPRRVVRNPRILGGEPTLEGTRVPVRSVVDGADISCGLDEIVDAYPMLNRASVETALDFYQVNQAEIDWHIDANAG